jgi:hypothetical protein
LLQFLKHIGDIHARLSLLAPVQPSPFVHGILNSLNSQSDCAEEIFKVPISELPIPA